MWHTRTIIPWSCLRNYQSAGRNRCRKVSDRYSQRSGCEREAPLKEGEVGCNQTLDILGVYSRNAATHAIYTYSVQRRTDSIESRIANERSCRPLHPSVLHSTSFLGVLCPRSAADDDRKRFLTSEIKMINTLSCNLRLQKPYLSFFSVSSASSHLHLLAYSLHVERHAASGALTSPQSEICQSNGSGTLIKIHIATCISAVSLVSAFFSLQAACQLSAWTARSALSRMLEWRSRNHKI